MAGFYLILEAIMLGYACYSWYWQANIDLKGQYRFSSIIWSLIFIWLGFSWQLIEKNDQGLTVFWASFILIGIIDGFTGFGAKKVVVAGYFKRTISYADIDLITLIRVPNPKKKQVICILTTNQNRQYYLRFAQSIAKIVGTIKSHVNHDIRIEIQDII